MGLWNFYLDGVRRRGRVARAIITITRIKNDLLSPLLVQSLHIHWWLLCFRLTLRPTIITVLLLLGRITICDSFRHLFPFIIGHLETRLIRNLLWVFIVRKPLFGGSMVSWLIGFINLWLFTVCKVWCRLLYRKRTMSQVLVPSLLMQLHHLRRNRIVSLNVLLLLLEGRLYLLLMLSNLFLVTDCLLENLLFFLFKIILGREKLILNFIFDQIHLFHIICSQIVLELSWGNLFFVHQGFIFSLNFLLGSSWTIGIR